MVDKPVADLYVDHFSRKPVLVDLNILGMESFQTSWFHTVIYHSSKYLMKSEICHRTDFLVPSIALETFLQHQYNTCTRYLRILFKKKLQSSSLQTKNKTKITSGVVDNSYLVYWTGNNRCHTLVVSYQSRRSSQSYPSEPDSCDMLGHCNKNKPLSFQLKILHRKQVLLYKLIQCGTLSLR